MIRFERVTKTYRMGSETLRALDEVSLHIAKGEFVAFLGPSGSGKSTAMNILGCLDSRFEGSYFLEGREVRGLGDDDLASIRNKKIGFVHQNFNLLPRLTALENVELPPVYSGTPRHRRREAAEKVLRSVGLGDRLGHLPIQLSGGQQQRVAIARALVNDASVIFADEPTGNLDSKSSVEIMTILQRLNERGATIVLVTHEADIAEWASRSIYFKDGKLGG